MSCEVVGSMVCVGALFEAVDAAFAEPTGVAVLLLVLLDKDVEV